MISMRMAKKPLQHSQKSSLIYRRTVSLNIQVFLVIKVGRKDNEERWPTDSVPILWLRQGCSHLGLQSNMQEDSTRETLSLSDRGNSNNFSYAFVLPLLHSMASLLVHIMPFEMPILTAAQRRRILSGQVICYLQKRC